MIRRFSLALVALSAVGCATFTNRFHTYDADDARDAAARGDDDLLKKMCNSSLDRSMRISSDGSAAACAARTAHYAHRVIAAPCERKLDLLDKQPVDVTADVGVAKSFFACGEGDRFVARTGVATAWAEAGLPVGESALRVLSGPELARTTQPALHGIIWYLTHSRTFAPSCDAIVANFRDKSVTFRREAASYFVAAKCAGAAPIYEDLLADESAPDRKLACATLGEIGGRSSLAKVGIIATTDAAFDVVDLNKVYFVRDACRAAVGKIRLRALRR